MKLKVLMYPEESGGFSVVVPALRGCYSEGDTLEEALANAREAAEGWLEASEGGALPEQEPGARVAEIEL